MPHIQEDSREPPQFEDEKVLSVTNLNRMAKLLLEDNFPAVVVEGEISNLATPASGHWYLTLKDKTSQIRCAMFVNRNRLVRFKPQNGKQIIVRGRLSIYEGRGDYQLIADSMEDSGDGALRRAFEELKSKLQTIGLFDEDAKQEVHSSYDHIGVVTSPTGAAIRDILSVFERRFPATLVTLFPVSVQGAEAKREIVNAIETANRLRGKLGVQALIISRGGGSLEDLQAFNEEDVAQAIFASDLPITSAVGHEIDFTIADFVADLRAPTPSAAAEQLSPSQFEYLEILQSYLQQFTRAIGKRLQSTDRTLALMYRQLKRPDRRLQEHAQKLDRFEGQLQLAIRNRIALQHSELLQRKRGLQFSTPLSRIRQLLDQVGAKLKTMERSMQADVQIRQAKLSELSRGLEAVSPLNTLSRGYSITYNADMKVIRQSDDVKIGGEITSRLKKGSIVSTVKATLNEDS
ncbi:MAG: exodeoxyribonuclease VII large subunit [Gammaproteobacteria bacterium]|nr:exodeoxyribonuclease VII large subunit [Gammaproteobacteria bacterium]MEC9218325.1 exodeoxyribonuclease VII large subunit [Pseudomonadota bacterium]MEC9223813.1 exodeoxyribonuclease VII large subunit [Pseudomonadota bacterium]